MTLTNAKSMIARHMDAAFTKKKSTADKRESLAIVMARKFPLNVLEAGKLETWAKDYARNWG